MYSRLVIPVLGSVRSLLPLSFLMPFVIYSKSVEEQYKLFLAVGFLKFILTVFKFLSRLSVISFVMVDRIDACCEIKMDECVC